MFPLLAWILFSGLTITTLAATNSTADTFNILKSPNITKPGCPAKCGDLTVPYPFGIGSGCGIGEWFELNCTDAFDPPQAFMIGNIKVYEISDSQMRVSNRAVTWRCYDRRGAVIETNNASFDINIGANYALYNMTIGPYRYSELNKLTVVGCDDFGTITSGSDFSSSCQSFCSRAEDVIGGHCSGANGCCQTFLAKGQKLYVAGLGSLDNHTAVWSFNPCGYAFLGEQESFVFRGAPDLSEKKGKESFLLYYPTVQSLSNIYTPLDKR